MRGLMHIFVYKEVGAVGPPYYLGRDYSTKSWPVRIIKSFVLVTTLGHGEILLG